MSVFASMCAAVSMALSGARTSWLTIAMSSLRAVAACSAAFLARTRSRSYRRRSLASNSVMRTTNSPPALARRSTALKRMGNCRDASSMSSAISRTYPCIRNSGRRCVSQKMRPPAVNRSWNRQDDRSHSRGRALIATKVALTLRSVPSGVVVTYPQGAFSYRSAASSCSSGASASGISVTSTEEGADRPDRLLGSAHVRAMPGRLELHELGARESCLYIAPDDVGRDDVFGALDHQRPYGHRWEIRAVVGHEC